MQPRLFDFARLLIHRESSSAVSIIFFNSANDEHIVFFNYFDSICMFSIALDSVHYKFYCMHILV